MNAIHFVLLFNLKQFQGHASSLQQPRMRRRKASWHNFTSNSGSWTLVRQSNLLLVQKPLRAWKLWMCWCPDREHPCNGTMTQNTTEVLWSHVTKASDALDYCKPSAIYFSRSRMKNRACGGRLTCPSQTSHVSICTQIWCFNRIEFFLSLITLCVLLHKGAESSSSYMPEGSGLISPHTTHQQGHCLTLLKSFKALWRLSSYSHSISCPMEIPLYNADLLSVSLKLKQGKWTRAQTSRMRLMGNSCVAYQLLLAYGKFLHRHIPPWGPELATW